MAWVIGYILLELYIGQASKYDAMGLQPMKRLLYTWFGNCHALFGLSELLGHMYAVWGWDWNMALYELSTGNLTIIPAFYWCMGLTELNYFVSI